MLTGKKIPIGIENFEEMRREDFYYVDKTCMIRDLLNQWGKVNLFTRPRRFGKSLNMSMLQYFFGYGCDSRLFLDGMETVLQYGIACYKKRCRIRLQSSNDRKNASAKEA